MSEGIMPIETVYNGYRFRSRLEARWAVFFDAAGIKYQYEPEGFQTEIGDKRICYLPDFYLPDIGTYVEVKPNYEKLMSEKDKLGALIDFDGPLANGLLVLGQIPYYANGELSLPSFAQFYWDSGVCARFVCFDVYDCFGRLDTDLLTVMDLLSCEAQTLPDLHLPPWHKNYVDTLYLSGCVPVRERDHHFYQLSRKDTKFVSEYYQGCFEKARQARFEHGEKPAISRSLTQEEKAQLRAVFGNDMED